MVVGGGMSCSIQRLQGRAGGGLVLLNGAGTLVNGEALGEGEERVLHNGDVVTRAAGGLQFAVEEIRGSCRKGLCDSCGVPGASSKGSYGRYSCRASCECHECCNARCPDASCRCSDECGLCGDDEGECRCEPFTCQCKGCEQLTNTRGCRMATCGVCDECGGDESCRCEWTCICFECCEDRDKDPHSEGGRFGRFRHGIVCGLCGGSNCWGDESCGCEWMCLCDECRKDRASRGEEEPRRDAPPVQSGCRVGACGVCGRGRGGEACECAWTCQCGECIDARQEAQRPSGDDADASFRYGGCGLRGVQWTASRCEWTCPCAFCLDPVAHPAHTVFQRPGAGNVVAPFELDPQAGEQPVVHP